MRVSETEYTRCLQDLPDAASTRIKLRLTGDIMRTILDRDRVNLRLVFMVNKIWSSVEFDWCGVRNIQVLRRIHYHM